MADESEILQRLLDVAERRRTFELEVAAGVEPTLSEDDKAWLRDLRASEGGYALDATWQLPSGLILSGQDVADLPEEK